MAEIPRQPSNINSATLGNVVNSGQSEGGRLPSPSLATVTLTKAGAKLTAARTEEGPGRILPGVTESPMGLRYARDAPPIRECILHGRGDGARQKLGALEFPRRRNGGAKLHQIPIRRSSLKFACPQHFGRKLPFSASYVRPCSLLSPLASGD